jgi:hypothetical protein
LFLGRQFCAGVGQAGRFRTRRKQQHAFSFLLIPPQQGQQVFHFQGRQRPVRLL